MTKRGKSVILFLLVLIGLSGCFEFRIPEIGPIKPPIVEVGPYEFYVASMTVNFDTLIAMMPNLGDSLKFDDLRETYPDDLSGETDWFVLRETFSESFPLEDMGLEVDPVSSSVSQSMEFIEFSTRNFNLSEPIELQDILDLDLLPDGTPVPIDSVAIDPDTSYAHFPMVRQRFSSGTLEVTINNDLQCNLGIPISMTVYDSLTALPVYDAGGDTLRLVWDTPILPGTTSTKSVSLAGVEFPEGIMIITEGVICGDEPDTLLVSDAMKTSSFSASGAISNLIGEFVEGDLDPQFLTETNTISFGDDLNDPKLSVDKVYLDTCHVGISITNTSGITGKILLDLMSLDTSATAGIQHFTTDSLIIPSNSTATYTFNLYNASVSLEDDFEYSSYINIPGQYGELDASDEYSLTFEFYGASSGDPIKIKSVDATFNDMEYVFNDMTLPGMNIGEMLSEQFSGIELSRIDLALDVLSDITIPMTLDMNLIGVKNDGADSLSISISQQITGPGSDNHVVFDDAVDIINFKPDSLVFNGKISLDGSGNFPLEQTIQVDGEIAVPMQFAISEPLSLPMGYSAETFGDLPSFLNDFSGSIKAQVNNTFQFGVNFLMQAASDTNYFDNIAYADSVMTLIDIVIPALDTTTQYIELTKEDYDALASMKDSAWLSMGIELTGRTDGQPTTFLSTDYVTLDLFIQAAGTLDIGELLGDTTNTDTTGVDTTGGAQ